MTDIFEKAFGKAPEKGYKFGTVQVDLIDNNCFKGFDISWSAYGYGFGHVWIGWGLDMERLKDYPNQQGFYTDSECMSKEFLEALMKEAAPKIAKIIIDFDRSK